MFRSDVPLEHLALTTVGAFRRLVTRWRLGGYHFNLHEEGILLIGIVVNNSIILIDFIQQRRDTGEDRRTAIESSVEARFRPIMMTSLSTIVGMIPLAMEWALGAERFSPLAVAVIGGMTAATFLTMIVIPVFYSAMDDFGGLFRKQEQTGNRG